MASKMNKRDLTDKDFETFANIFATKLLLVVQHYDYRVGDCLFDLVNFVHYHAQQKF